MGNKHSLRMKGGSTKERRMMSSSLQLTFKSTERNRRMVQQFARGGSLSSEESKLSPLDRRLSLDDILDEKEEEVKRASSLSQLLDLDGDVQIHHFIRQSSRTSSTETMSSSEQTRCKNFFSKKKVTHDTSSSMSSLSKVTLSSKTSGTKSSQSSQNLEQLINETKPAAINQLYLRSRQQSPSSSPRPPPVPKPKEDKVQEDLDLLMRGGESPEQELAMGRIIAKMDALGDTLKSVKHLPYMSRSSSDDRRSELDTLEAMNDLIRKAWAVNTIGYDLGSGLCRSLFKGGILDILLKNFTSDDDLIRFESARLLEQSLTTENRNYIVNHGLTTTVKIACDLSHSLSCEKSRIGTGILEHLFKNTEEICFTVIRLGGLSAVLIQCRNCDVDTLRHCAAALVNLSLHGGPENQEAMIQHKAPEWLFPLAFNSDDNIKYYACLAIAVLVANKEIEAAVLRSGTLELVEPFVTTHSPEDFSQSTVAHVHGQSRAWLQKLVPVLNSQREEARNLAAFHFAMEAGIKKRRGQTKIFNDIGVVAALQKAASSPSAITSKYAAQALQLIGEQVPHKLSQQVPLWTVEDVVEWVKQTGFAQYSQEFLDSKVDGDLLLRLSDKALSDDIGVSNGILRQRFQRELNQLKKMADYTSCDSTGLCQFLQGLGCEFLQYAYPMLWSGVQYSNLGDLTQEQLSDECRIDNSIHRMKVLQAAKELTGNRGKESDDENKCLDVFISYRRSNGSQLASLLKVHLQLKDFSVFIDVERLEAGKFDNNLLQSVRQARYFVLVLTENALDRCIGDTECKDWVHREIVEALQNHCRIIPILHNFQWPEPDSLPSDMRDISYFNGVRWVHDYQDACVEKLVKFMRGEVKADGPVGSKPVGMGSGTPGTPISAPPKLLSNNPIFNRTNSTESDSNSR